MSHISIQSQRFIYRQQSQIQTQHSKTLEKLSSGLCINRAGDNAAGLSISESMRVQIRGLNQATRNIQDGISLIHVADSAMNEMQAILTRCSELSVQALNGTYNTDDLLTIQQELNQLTAELEEIYWTTSFNEIPLLQGSSVKTVNKSETVITQVEIEESIFETKGELPSWVSGSGFGYLKTDGITFNETFYNTSVDRIVCEDGTEVTSFKTASGVFYQQGSTRVDSSVSGATSTLTVKGEDGLSYTIYRTHSPFQQEQTHAGSFLDFSGLDQGQDWKDLVGTGFQTTCCSCEKRYSLKFTDGASGRIKDGDHFIYEIDISNVQSSAELLERIQTVLQNYGQTETRVDDKGQSWDVVVPENHFTGFSVEKDVNGQPTGRLLVYDFPNSTYTRKPNPTKEQGIFASGYYESTIVKNYQDVLTTVTTPVQVNGKDLILQVGEEDHEKLVVELPDLHLDELTLTGNVDILTDQASRLKTQTAFLKAKDVVNGERGRMGAIQNRLDSLFNRTQIEHENLSQAESRIRDTDYGKELIAQAKQSLLLTSTQSLFHQATLSSERVLQLLQ